MNKSARRLLYRSMIILWFFKTNWSKNLTGIDCESQTKYFFQQKIALRTEAFKSQNCHAINKKQHPKDMLQVA